MAVRRARSAGRRLDGPIALPVAVGVACAGHGIPLAAGARRLSACARRQSRSPPACGSFRSGRPTASASLAALEPVVAATAPRALGDAARRDRQRGVPRRPRQHAPRDAIHAVVPAVELRTMARCSPNGPLRVGVGGPVGSGKTALMDALCKRLRDRYEIAAITNDIYTKWDAEYLVRSGALAPERIAGVETGGCPHTAIREDASINLAAVADMRTEISGARPDPDRVGRRQSRRDLLARAGRSDDLRHRRRGRRQDSRRRAGPASRAPICWSSTRSISRPMSAPRSR